MLEFLVALMLYAFWIALILGTAGLFVLRLIYVLSRKPALGTALFVLFVPLSIGYFLKNPRPSRFRTLYLATVSLAVFLMAIGAVMIYYAHFG